MLSPSIPYGSPNDCVPVGKQEDDHVPNDASDARRRNRNEGIARRRPSPHFVILDHTMKVLCSTPGHAQEVVFDEAFAGLATTCRRSKKTHTEIFESFNDKFVLRIMPLPGAMIGCVAVFIEAFDRDDPIVVSAKEFGLTRRETEVLRLLVSGKSNAEIALALFVAETTVGDHMKSIMRKSASSKRAEVIGKVFGAIQTLGPTVTIGETTA